MRNHNEQRHGIVKTVNFAGEIIEASYLNDQTFFTTKRDQGGSGLGTHITLNLVKQTLNGEIEVSSEEGKGLSYMIRFPKTLQQPTNMFD